MLWRVSPPRWPCRCRRRGEGWQSACNLLLNHHISLFKAYQSGLTDRRVSFPACVMEVLSSLSLFFFSPSPRRSQESEKSRPETSHSLNSVRLHLKQFVYARANQNLWKEGERRELQTASYCCRWVICPLTPPKLMLSRWYKQLQITVESVGRCSEVVKVLFSVFGSFELKKSNGTLRL